MDSNTFNVVTKTGETRYYGSRSDARVMMPTFQGGPNDNTVIWALDRVMDTWGNYYDLHYNNDHLRFFRRE